MTGLLSLFFTQDFMLSGQKNNTIGPISDFIPWTFNCILAKKITSFILGNTQKSKQGHFYLRNSCARFIYLWHDLSDSKE